MFFSPINSKSGKNGVVKNRIKKVDRRLLESPAKKTPKTDVRKAVKRKAVTFDENPKTSTNPAVAAAPASVATVDANSNNASTSTSLPTAPTAPTAVTPVVNSTPAVNPTINSTPAVNSDGVVSIVDQEIANIEGGEAAPAPDGGKGANKSKKKPNGYYELPADIDRSFVKERPQLQVIDYAGQVDFNEFVSSSMKKWNSGNTYPAINFAYKNEVSSSYIFLLS